MYNLTMATMMSEAETCSCW